MSIRVHFLDAERKALYGAIFPDGVPVKGPVPTLCELGDIGEHPCYLLDVEAVEWTRQSQLAGALAQKFGTEPSVLMGAMATVGLPIRAEQTTLVLDGPHLGLLMPDAVAEDGLVSIRGRYMADDDWDDEGYDWLYDDDDAPDDDIADFYDPAHCPRCGEWLDSDGCCMDMECGWSIADDDDFADFDDDDSGENDPTLCPKCGQQLDGDGHCWDMLSCGYSITRDDDAHEIPF